MRKRENVAESIKFGEYEHVYERGERKRKRKRERERMRS